MTKSRSEGSLTTVRGLAALRARVAEWRLAGEIIALVPTMGALHEGHGALMAAARKASDRVIVSIFVNPTQFGPSEDFAAYPRDEAADAAFLDAAGVDLLYAPSADAMYPEGFATLVSVPELGGVLCGTERSGHFDGVATVVTKLINQVTPDAAYFGEKDYQQLVIIRRVVLDLDLPVRVEGVATVRASDGLAISSRNAYLGAKERAIAPALYVALKDAAQRIGAGAEIEGACAEARAALIAVGFSSVDYLQYVDVASLEPLATQDRSARILAAAHLGRVRLIDNVAIKN